MLASWQPLSSQPNPPNPRFAPTAPASALPSPVVQGYDPFAETGSPFGREVYNTGRLESLGLPPDAFNRTHPPTGTGFGASTLPTTTGSFSDPLPQAPPPAVVHSNQWLAPTLAVIAGAGTLATAIKRPEVFTKVLPDAFQSLQGKVGQWFSKQGAEAVQQTSDDLAGQGTKVVSQASHASSLSPVATPIVNNVVEQTQKAVESDADRLVREAAEQMQMAQEAMLQRVAMAEGRNQAEDQAFNAAATQAQKLGVDADAIENAKTTQELHELVLAHVGRRDAEQLALRNELTEQANTARQALEEANTRHADALKQQQQQVRSLVVEKQELTQQQSSLEASIKELELKQQQAATAKSEKLETITQQLVEQKRQAEALAAQLKAKDEALETAKVEKGLLEQTNREQQVLASNSLAVEKRLEDETKALKKRYNQALDRMKGMEEDIATARQTLDAEGKVNSSLTEVLEKTRTQLSETKAQQTGQVKSLEQQLTELQQRHETQVATLRRNSQNLETQEALLNGRIKQLQSTYEVERSGLQSQLDQAQKAVKGTQDNLAKVEAELGTLKAELAKVKQLHTEAQTNLDEMLVCLRHRDALEQLITQAKTLESRAKELEQQQIKHVKQAIDETLRQEGEPVLKKVWHFIQDQMKRNAQGDTDAQGRHLFIDPKAGKIDPLQGTRAQLMKERDVLLKQYQALKSDANKAIDKQNAFLSQQAAAEGKAPELLQRWSGHGASSTLDGMQQTLISLNKALDGSLPKRAEKKAIQLLKEEITASQTQQAAADLATKEAQALAERQVSEATNQKTQELAHQTVEMLRTHAQKLGVDPQELSKARTPEEVLALVDARVNRRDAEMTGNLKALSETLGNTQEELTIVRAELTKTLKEQKAELSRLRAETNAARQALLQERATLNTQIDNLTEQKRVAESQNSEDLANITKQLDETTEKANSLAKTLKEKEAALRAAEAKTGQLEAENRAQGVYASNLLATQKQLEQQIQQTQQQHAQALKQMEGMEAEVQQAKQALAKEGNANSTLNEQLGQVRKQLTELQTNQEAKVSDLQATLATKQAEYEKAVATIRKNSQGLASAKEAGDKKIAQLTQDHAQQRVLLEDKLRQANETVQTTQQKLTQVETALTSAQKELTQTQGTLHAKQGELAELQAKVKQTETALNEKQRALEALDANNKKQLKTETEALHIKHQEALDTLNKQNTDEAQHLQQQVASLKTEADSLKQQHAHALQIQEASLKQTSDAKLNQLEQQLQEEVKNNRLTQEQLAQQLATAKQTAQQELETALASTRQAHAQALGVKEDALQQATDKLELTKAKHQAELQEVQQGFDTQLASVTSKHQAEQAELTQQLNDLQTELAMYKQQYHNAMQEVTTAYDALQRLGNLMQEGDTLAKRAEALASRQATVLQQQATEAGTAKQGGLFVKAKQFVKDQVERNMHGDEAAQTRNVLTSPTAGNIDPLKAERDALMKERDLLQQRYATLKQQADEAIGKQNAFLTRQAQANGNKPQLLALWQGGTPHPTLAPMEVVLQRLNQAIENATPL